MFLLHKTNYRSHFGSSRWLLECLFCDCGTTIWVLHRKMQEHARWPGCPTDWTVMSYGCCVSSASRREKRRYVLSGTAYVGSSSRAEAYMLLSLPMKNCPFSSGHCGLTPSVLKSSRNGFRIYQSLEASQIPTTWLPWIPWWMFWKKRTQNLTWTKSKVFYGSFGGIRRERVALYSTKGREWACSSCDSLLVLGVHCRQQFY